MREREEWEESERKRRRESSLTEIHCVRVSNREHSNRDTLCMRVSNRGTKSIQKAVTMDEPSYYLTSLGNNQ